MVRLKVEHTAPLVEGCDVFQFHSGSIKSAHQSARACNDLCFNSIVVRLKDADRVKALVGDV